jgi:hypothetical protein
LTENYRNTVLENKVVCNATILKKMNSIFCGVFGCLQRTKHRSLQEQWLKALLESIALPNISSPVRTLGGPVHFRYSMENLPVIEEVYNVFCK